VTQKEGRAERIREITRALNHRDYRIYFFGMLVSFSGTWMQSVAQSWLVFRLTGSEWLLGLIGFASQIPVFLLTPLGGVVADRKSRHRIIILTQILMMIQAAILAALTLSGRVTVGAVFALALALGLVNAFDLPARQSFLVELVGKQDLMNAIALNSSMIQASRVLGPSMAGIIIAWLGEGACFLVNAISYLAVLAGLLVIRPKAGRGEQAAGSALSNLKEGFDYVRRTRPIRALLLMVAFVSIFGLSYIVLLPVFAAEVLEGGPSALGFLTGAAGLGAMTGALTLAARRQVEGLGRVVAASAALFGVMIIIFSLSRALMLSTALLVPVGFALLLQMAASNTLLQTMVPDRMRGRVMSFFSMSLMGMAPFGSLLSGAVATRLGAPRTVALGGMLCLVAALLFWMKLPSLSRDAATILIAQGAMAGEPTEAHTIRKN
jgi:MFS family permease